MRFLALAAVSGIGSVDAALASPRAWPRNDERAWQRTPGLAGIIEALAFTLNDFRFIVEIVSLTQPPGRKEQQAMCQGKGKIINHNPSLIVSHSQFPKITRLRYGLLVRGRPRSLVRAECLCIVERTALQNCATLSAYSGKVPSRGCYSGLFGARPSPERTGLR